MTKIDKLLLAVVAALCLTAAANEWIVTGSITITPPSGIRGVVIVPDVTSPAAAPLHLGPQDTAPTSCSIGDLAVVGNTLEVCTDTNTWTVVGSQS